MSALTILGGNAPLTMTSREIAALTGKEHRNVLRDARAMLAELHGEGGVLSFEQTYRDPQNGQSYPMLALPKRETLILVSGYSVTMRAKIIDRWQELEHAQLPDQVLIPQTLPEALRFAADLADKKAQVEAALAVAAPKAAALDMISAGDEDLTITQAAKVLGVKIMTLTNWMSANGWVYRQNGSWVAYQQQIENGRLRYKEAHYTDQKTLQACIRPYCHITPKGLAKLALVFGQGERAA